MTEYLCPFCGSEATIKDNDRFSSLLCSCSILIYYYDNAIWTVITKDEYIDYKKQKRG
jgi:hypothetical protein